MTAEKESEVSFERRLDFAKKTRSPAILYQLGKDPSPAIRKEAGRNENSPEDLVSDLLKDADINVVIAAIKNSRASEGDIAAAYARFSGTAHEQEMLQAAIKSPNCPPHLLCLASQGSRSSKLVVAGHKKTPVKAIEELSFDPDFEVRRRAHETLLTIDPQKLTTERAKRLLEAKSPKTAPQRLQELVSDEELAIKIAAGENPSTPDDGLEKLLMDKNVQARGAIPRNPVKRSGLLVRMAQTENAQSVLHALLESDHSDDEILLTALSRENSPAIRYLANLAATDRKASEKIVCFLYERNKTDILSSQINDLILSREVVPMSILEELATGKDRSLAAKALRRLRGKLTVF